MEASPAPPTMSPSQEFVFYRTYSRWNEDLSRRETWEETTTRYFDFMHRRFHGLVPQDLWADALLAVQQMDVMPSMRALWAAGPALERNNIIGYNCAALAFKDLESVAELFYILMCGTGVGFSIEREYIEQIPAVRLHWDETEPATLIVGDSREGWAEALLAGLETWFGGGDVAFDYSKIRPRGARLKTMGGRASGPEPLKKLLDYVRTTVLNAQGRKLTSLEWLDIGNMIGEVVVVGGVRRSSEITFSDLDDVAIRDAKNYSTGDVPAHRAMSNNSAVYNGRPDIITFMREWTALAASGSGERGIFNLVAAMQACPRREPSEHFRTNPCGEINLRADTGQFCNLSEVIIRANDTVESVQDKIEIAVWLGAMQACLTNFPFLRESYAEQCRKERLLGVSLTGQMDNPALCTPAALGRWKQHAIDVAASASRVLGINMPTAVTTGKPSGTVSQLVDCASGAHPRFAPYYLRRYRISATDPLFHMLRDQGVVFTPENGQGPDPDTVQTWVCAFPEKAPDGAVVRDDVTAMDQLEWYLKLKHFWCEHNQSITIYVRDHEWLSLGAAVYRHFDSISGVSFLPYDGGHYRQAPYEAISKEEYEAVLKAFPKIDYTQLSKYELEDNTTGAQTYACVGDKCELV